MHVEDRGRDLRVTLKVEVNDLLKQWVMFFGNIAHVEKPKSLQKMILETAKDLVAQYDRK